ncbi:stage III sporulation protein AA [Fontibacillus panacisegetis]|uniref:Stage III sporulation protein AA n=1 Tax=Fontibacillus panacisegetis TaxID=670482 RepID=A0A1G7R9N3_9BACL|nr:stage III sporulation protein AA [Fontibacillus panacisegetis]SDG07478.1 stage III sporulation protein AA [Fontibacillus panacisegetis]
MSPSWLTVFPDNIRSLLSALPPSVFGGLEEIRIREGRPLEINAGGRFCYLTSEGGMTLDAAKAFMPSKQECNRLLDLITNHSLYTMEEELRKGFITIEGGHRIGLAGRTVLGGGKVEHLRDISGYNVRLAREIKGLANTLLPQILDFKHKSVLHTLILSPPQQGKTTLIRDLARQISSGTWRHPEARWPGMKVGIIDERSEIAGSKRGVPSFDVGPRTDVMDGCPKAEGMMMMIRSMSPDVLIVDEIGRSEDVDALAEALHAGVRVIATAHGSNVDDLSSRPAMSRLLECSFFQMYAVLKRTDQGMAFRLWDDKRRRVQLPDGPAREAKGREVNA